MYLELSCINTTDERRAAKDLLLRERMVDDRELLVAEVSSNVYRQYDSAQAAAEETDCADDDGLALKAEDATTEWVNFKVLTQAFGGGDSCLNMGGAAAVLFTPVSLLSLTSVSESWRWSKVDVSGAYCFILLFGCNRRRLSAHSLVSCLTVTSFHPLIYAC